MNVRKERDSVGELDIKEDAYYGIHSARANQNFHITGRRMNPAFILSLVEIKKAAAITNRDAGLLNKNTADFIIRACDEISAGKLLDQFIVDPVQGGAGTSANMNANEVIANRAIELMGGKKGNYSLVHPNDHVNMSQSTNDVFPTAGKLTTVKLLKDTCAQLERLKFALEKKAAQFHDVIKIGRTQLQDAVPIRLGQSFQAYASVIGRDIERLTEVQKEMLSVNIGGTAVGTAVNVSPQYLSSIAGNVRKITGIPVVQAADLVDATQNVDGFVCVSNTLKTCAVNLSKIANDLRLLSSGPKAGIGEISLPHMQNGSSIMPGKINPVIPEVVSQVAFHIIGNNMTITMAAEAGQLELNAFEPIIFYGLFESIDMLNGVVPVFVDNCVAGITANTARCEELLNRTAAIATALCPYIGYNKSAEIVKEALSTGASVTQIVLKSNLILPDLLGYILNPVNMTQPNTVAR